MKSLVRHRQYLLFRTKRITISSALVSKIVLVYRYSAITALIALLVTFLGCDSQKNFKPNIIKGKITFNSSLEQPIIQATRVSARLKNNTAISLDSKIIKLQPNQNLLFQDSQDLLVTNGCTGIEILPYTIQHDSQIIPQKDHAIHVDTQSCVISASKKDNMVAGVLADNTLFLYNTATKQMIFTDKGESIYAISSLNANPVFLDTVVIFPTLDGRLSTLNIKQQKIIKNIIVNTEKFLNNIIYLQVQKDDLISATQKKLYTLTRGESYSKDLEIRDVYFDGNFIYVLSLNGIIYQLDKTLATMQSVKLPYANLNGIIVKEGILYTLESHGGFLIALNTNGFNYDVFKLQGFKRNATTFYTNNTFFIDNKILNLNEPYHTTIYKIKPQTNSPTHQQLNSHQVSPLPNKDK
ncbi:plasminogen-binding protein pgbB [Helicobacter aurati]|uniref:Plasminogen-binding protein pgbB n=1 Tax=Helicobacter aurati TaxID=137778 RepID=A0A3D8J9Y0_9HELI|nr:plasminogen-binding protein pgbB [Helicobacter aurati]RDU73674.1 plasminogen-binding protein pgbB [Helicobacter aurati]